jgi:hypothetical protein
MGGYVAKRVNSSYGSPRFTGHTFIELTRSGLQADRKLGLICQTLYMDRIGLWYMFIVYLDRLCFMHCFLEKKYYKYDLLYGRQSTLHASSNHVSEITCQYPLLDTWVCLSARSRVRHFLVSPCVSLFPLICTLSKLNIPS